MVYGPASNVRGEPGGRDAGPSPEITSYEVFATALPGGRGIAAEARITLSMVPQITDSLVFFLHDELEVDSVLVGGSPTGFASRVVPYTFNYSTRALRTGVAMGKRTGDTDLRVFYHGPFSPSSERSRSDYMRVDTTGVLLRAYGYSLWFPICLESGESSHAVPVFTAHLRVPEGLRSVLVGSRKMSTETGPYWETEWVAEDVDLMQIQWSAQKWEVMSSGSYRAFHYPESGSEAASREILEFAEAITSVYQDRYRTDVGGAEIYVMEMPPFGMISSLNVAALPSREWQTFSDLEGVQVSLAHEMVHPFVAFSVPFDDPAWALIQEGFPSFFHLPALERRLGTEFYHGALEAAQSAYLEKRETGAFRGGKVQPEKPIFEISVSEVGMYKDSFVLNDRVRLFMDWLRRSMGNSEHSAFLHELFSRRALDGETFRGLVLKYLPGAEDDLRLWLETTSFPRRFHLPAGTPSPSANHHATNRTVPRGSTLDRAGAGGDMLLRELAGGGSPAPPVVPGRVDLNLTSPTSSLPGA